MMSLCKLTLFVAVVAISLVNAYASAPISTSVHAIGKAHLPGTRPGPTEPGGPVYPVGGNVWPIAIYFMYIHVGTPAKPYCVAIDSGSTTSAVSDISCTTCSKNPVNLNYYNSSDSSTSVLIQTDGYGGTYETCNFADPGAACSDSGNLYNETVGIGGKSLANYGIGSMTYIQSNFDQFQVCSGIMGLFGDTLFSELVAAGQYTQNIFGMCLSATEGAQSNGTINFGGIDETLYTGEIQWTANTDGVEYYQVQVNSAEVLGTTISSISGQAILDSGTNVFLIEQQPFDDFQTAFMNSCATGSKLHGVCDVPSNNTIFDGACFPYTPEQLDALPPITINLQNVTLVMPPSSYMNLYDPLGSNPDYYCLGLRVSDVGFIIGDIVMANYYVIFNNEALTIGWADASKKCGAEPLPTRQKKKSLMLV